MSNRSIKTRITRAEQTLTSAKGVISEIFIDGGLDPGVRAQIVGGQFYEGEPGEHLADLQIRVRAIAEAQGAKFIVYGGMRPPPAEWAEPPGMTDALEKAAWSNADEMDVEGP